MGYTTSGGPKGLGVFNNTPQTVADFNQLVTLIARMGNARVETTAGRDAITGTALYEGLLLYNTTTDSIEVYTGSGWDTVIEDTGWQIVVPSGTGFTPAATGSIRFRRINGVVYFSAAANNPSWGSADWSAAPIPVGFRPAQTFYFASVFNDVVQEIQMTAAGSLVIAKPGTGGIRVSGSYPVG